MVNCASIVRTGIALYILVGIFEPIETFVQHICQFVRPKPGSCKQKTPHDAEVVLTAGS